MSPVRREVDLYYSDTTGARQAAVLALLSPVKGSWHIHFIQRKAHPRDLHSGQISFPGGGLEANDASFEDCAKRETFEEIGVPQEQIRIIGSLTKLYVYASNNLVFPYVGYMEAPFEFIPDPKEVEKVISVPINYFLTESIIKKTTLKVREYVLPDVPYYDLHGSILWGATAMMMSELLYLWKRT